MTTRTVGIMEPARRCKLLATAAREFAAAGYERASLNRIIRACQMSKSSFYHYFDSKEALFDTVVREAAAALAAELAIPAPSELAGPDFWDRIAGLFAGLLTLTERGGAATELWPLVYLPDAPAAPGSALAEVLTRMMAWLDDVLRAGRASGAVRDDLPASLQAQLAIAVLRTMDEWSLHNLPALDAAARARLADQQLSVIRRLLAP